MIKILHYKNMDKDYKKNAYDLVASSNKDSFLKRKHGYAKEALSEYFKDKLGMA